MLGTRDDLTSRGVGVASSSSGSCSPCFSFQAPLKMRSIWDFIYMPVSGGGFLFVQDLRLGGREEKLGGLVRVNAVVERF